MKTFIVGTRQSDLALTQTNQVISQLKAIASEHGINCDFQIKKIVTKGDLIQDVTLSKVGGKGLFVKEIEQALLDQKIDMAVHSMKDMPSELLEGLMIGAIPKRVDPRDCLITKNNIPLQDLPKGAKVGTSSLRRSSQFKAYRNDLNIQWIRGNIDSRIKKLDAENYDAIVLASAGLQRVGWEHKISEYISPEICVPAVGQGALGIECRESDNETKKLLQLFNDDETALAVAAERSFLHRLNGSCQVPLGAYAVMQKESTAAISMTGMVGSPDGQEILKETMTGNDPKQLGIDMAERLIERGADRILAKVRG